MSEKNRINPSPFSILRGHTEAIISLKFIKGYNNKLLTSGDSDGNFKIWDITSLRSIYSNKIHDKSILSILNTEENNIITSSRDSTIKIWSLEHLQTHNTTPISILRSGHDHFCNISSINIHSCDTTYVVAAGIEQSEIFLWDLRSAGSNQIPAMKFFPNQSNNNSSFSGSSYSDNNITQSISRSDTFGMVTSLDACKINSYTNSKNNSINNNITTNNNMLQEYYIVTGYEDGSICLYDIRVPSNPLSIKKLHTEPIFAVNISPDGTNIITGGGDSSVYRTRINSNSSNHHSKYMINKEKDMIDITSNNTINDDIINTTSSNSSNNNNDYLQIINEIQLSPTASAIGTSCIRHRSDGRIIVSGYICWDCSSITIDVII